MDKETGEVKFRRNVMKVEEEYENLSEKFSLVSRDRFIFLSNKTIYLINLNGNIFWKKTIDFSLVKLCGSSNYLICLEKGKDNFLLH